MKIFFANVPYSIDEQELRQLFTRFGPVKYVRLLRDPATNKSKGHGFVQMVLDDDAERAINELNESACHGRRIIVKEARPKLAGRGANEVSRTAD